MAMKKGDALERLHTTSVVDK